MIAVTRKGVVEALISGVTSDGSGGWIGTDGRPWLPPPIYKLGDVVEVAADVRLGWVRRNNAWVPPHLADVEAARAWALGILAEAGRTTVRLPDGVLYSISDSSRADWDALWRAHDLEVEAGNPAGIFPQTFTAADGTEVVLDNAAEASTLYRALFAAGNAMRTALYTARAAVDGASTVEDVVAALAAVGAT